MTGAPSIATAPPRRRKDAGDHAAEGGFSAAGFADEPQRLAATDRERDVRHRLHRAGFHVGAAETRRDAVAERQVRREALGDMVDGEKGHRASGQERAADREPWRPERPVLHSGVALRPVKPPPPG
jgi:hypothetical protein